MFKKLSVIVTVVAIAVIMSVVTVSACKGCDNSVENYAHVLWLQQLLETLDLQSIEELQLLVIERGYIDFDVIPCSVGYFVPFCIVWPMICCGSQYVQRRVQMMSRIAGGYRAASVEWCRTCITVVSARSLDWYGRCICDELTLRWQDYFMMAWRR